MRALVAQDDYSVAIVEKHFLLQKLEKHKIVAIIRRKSPFEQVFDALDNMASPHLIGKSVLTFN